VFAEEAQYVGGIGDQGCFVGSRKRRERCQRDPPARQAPGGHAAAADERERPEYAVDRDDAVSRLRG
jgi:hypothetical protein